MNAAVAARTGWRVGLDAGFTVAPDFVVTGPDCALWKHSLTVYRRPLSISQISVYYAGYNFN
jgi:hypothetical protein